MPAGKARSKGKKRILVLMSDTGGGHRASAEALRSGFQILYGDQYHVRQQIAFAASTCFHVLCIFIRLLHTLVSAHVTALAVGCC